MPDRKMFWRIVRRLFAAQRGRLLVILLASAQERRSPRRC